MTMETPTDLKQLTVMFFDDGCFEELAISAGKAYGRVLYFTAWKEAFPKSNRKRIGTGMEGVERIYDFEKYIDQCDLFIFPGVGEGSLQEYLRSKGKLVWGSGVGENLEQRRYRSKEIFKSVGLPSNVTHKIIGLGALRKFLQENEGIKFIKTDIRGDFESKKSESYEITAPWLDSLQISLGGAAFDYEFIVEEPIDEPGTIEIGYDGFTVDGQFPSKAISGIEIKDKAYVCCVKEYNKISPLITSVNTKLSPVLKEFMCRTFFSTEIRVGKSKKSYLLEPTMRSGSPPSELYQEMITNLWDIVFWGAQGRLVEPKYLAKYGAEAMITSDTLEDQWLPVYFPPEIRRWVKLKNACKIDGKYYCIPQDNKYPEVGAVVGTGNTMKEAIENVKKYAEMIKGDGIHVHLHFDDAQEELDKCSALGIYF